MKRLHLAFLGCGAAAAMHARRLRRMFGDAVAISFASRDGARASDACRRFEGRRAYSCYEAAIAAGDVDAVVVTTPTALHAGLAVDALEAGKHALVEKPGFMSVAEADRVLAAARTHSRLVMVAENYFYKPIAEHLRAVIVRGELGDVRFVTINATKLQPMRGWRANPALSGGGALFEGGVHWVNFASNIGLDVIRVQHSQAGDPSTPELSSLVVFRYANGAVGTLAHSWELKAPLRGMRLSKVQGTLGSVTFESNGFAHVTTGLRPSAGLMLRDPQGYAGMLEDFVAAVRSGRPPRFTLEMARRDLAIVAPHTSLEDHTHGSPSHSIPIAPSSELMAP